MVNLVVHGASTNTLNDGEYRWSKRRKADETEIPLKLEASNLYVFDLSYFVLVI